MEVTTFLLFLGGVISIGAQNFDNPTSRSLIGAKPKCQCDERYFLHYRIKGCQPIVEDGCHCPKRFDCPSIFMKEENECHYNGSAYKLGDDIPTSNPCQICSCREGAFGKGVRIDCISVECPGMFQPPLEEGCYEKFSTDRCCSVGKACDGGKDSEFMCEFEGKKYHLGQKMYSTKDPCLSCLCDESWTGEPGPTCKTYDCMLEKDMKRLLEGCLPIYHESTCCPIEYFCPSEDHNKTEIISGGSNDDPSNVCVFNFKEGSVGDKLEIHHPTNCVECSCQTPPEFTCVHKTCPRSPADDSGNCQPIYKKGVCCPDFECKSHAPSILVCQPVECGEGCTKMTVPHGCPICMCDNVLCSMPNCDSDCVLDYESRPCPSCKCNQTDGLDAANETVALTLCKPVTCSPECIQGIDSVGCPMCVCGNVCAMPNCSVGCEVKQDEAGHECPYCVCIRNGEIFPDFDQAILCAPINCPAFCREAMGDHGCPMCQCDPLCSPPKCDPGCEIETIPSSGPCPGCDCSGIIDLVPETPHCDPVKCPESCQEFTVPNGCPICQCQDILCSIPNCPPGCDIDYNIQPGSCPSCKCPIFIQRAPPMCDPVRCGPDCYNAISPQGCPICICGPLCSPPKCDANCTLQTDVPHGQCPGCVCPIDIDSGEPQQQCAPVKCPSGCSETIGPNGCPSCMCEPLCSPPKCSHGCYPEVVPTSGPCPGCVCNREVIMCEVVFCGPGCKRSFDSDGCPKCVCTPLCSPPRCDPGCHIQHMVPDGECPGCECPEIFPLTNPGEFQWCAPVKCDPGCQEVFEEGRCPACKCNDQCGQSPECPENCHLETNVPPGQCPECKCPIITNEKPRCPELPCMLPCRLVRMSPMTCPVCECVNPFPRGIRRPTTM